MRRVLSCGLLLGLVASVSAAPLPLKVLVFTRTDGFRHSSVVHCERLFRELGPESGLFTAEISQDLAVFSADNLKQYQVLVLYGTGNWKLTDEQRAALLGYVDAGGGILGIHSSTDTCYDWPAYGELMGGYFDGHPWNQVVKVKVEQPGHPACDGLGTSFEFHEEIYQYRNWSRDKVTVLMSLDNSSVDVSKGKRADKDYAIVWCKEQGRGRVLTNGFGHHDAAFQNPLMIKMILNGLKWLARLDAASNPELRELAARGDFAGLLARAETLPAALRSEPIKAIALAGTPAAAAKLAELAGPGQPEAIREAAVQALGNMDAAGLEELIKLLEADLPSVRISAVQALARRGGERAEAALVKALQDPSVKVRLAAVEALGAMTSPTVQKELLKLLDATDSDLRRAALGALSPADPAVRAELIRRIEAGPAFRVTPYVLKLGGAAADEQIFALLVGLVEGDKPASLKVAAVQAIGASGRPDALDKISAWMFADDASVATAANDAAKLLPGLNIKDRLSAFIPAWALCGPFEKRGHDDKLPPEDGIDLTAEYPGAGGRPAVWVLGKSVPEGWVDLKAALNAPDNSVAYAHTVIRVPRDMKAQLRLGSDDGCKVWLNDKQVWSRDIDRGLTIDEDVIPVELTAGDNKLLVKVLQGGGDFSLAVRLASPGGGLDQLQFVTPPVQDAALRGGRLTDFIRAWRIVGPFPNADGNAGHNVDFGPEAAVDLTAKYRGIDGEVAWRPYTHEGDRLDFNAALGRRDNAAGYAYTVITAPEDMTCELRVGSDDGVKVWLGGKLVVNFDGPRGLTVDQEKVTVQLKAGANPLLCKVMNGAADWALTVRLARPEGGLNRLKIAAE